MARPKHMTEDPATGELVSLQQLAIRHDHNYATIQRRYCDGKRGLELIKAVPEGKKRAGKLASASRNNRQTAASRSPATRKQVAGQVLATPAGKLASRLFRDYAA